MNLLPIDELNLLKLKLQTWQIQGQLNKEDCIDAVLDLLILAYVYGVQDAGESLDITITPDANAMQSVIYHKIEGKDFAQRVTEYFEGKGEGASKGELLSKLNRIADTESHRVYNTSVLDSSKGVATQKTWHTMMDNKVRDTHTYLNGVTLPIDAEFYTYNGDKAYAPGQFGVAEEDCNCRCYITVR